MQSNQQWTRFCSPCRQKRLSHTDLTTQPSPRRLAVPTDTSLFLYSQDFRQRTIQSSEECSSVTLFAPLPIETKQVFYFWNFLTLQLATCRPFSHEGVFIFYQPMPSPPERCGSQFKTCPYPSESVLRNEQFGEAPSHLFPLPPGPAQPDRPPGGKLAPGPRSIPPSPPAPP